MKYEILQQAAEYCTKSKEWQQAFDLAFRAQLEAINEQQAEIDALKAQNADLLAAQQWRDIESAPKDQRVLIIDEFGVHQAVASRKIGGHWKTHSNTPEGVWRPKFWQPLPQPPEVKARGDL